MSENLGGIGPENQERETGRPDVLGNDDEPLHSVDGAETARKPVSYEYGEEVRPPVGGMPSGPQDEIPPSNPASPYAANPQQPVPPMGQNGQTTPPLPPQQTQWTFNDYGPLGSTPKESKPPKAPKPPKQKKERARKEKAPNSGYKVLAILMCILFVLSVAGFGGYIAYDLNRESGVTPPAGGAASRPGLNVQDTPQDDGTDDDGAATIGKMSNNDVYKKVEPAVVGVVGYARGVTGTQLAGQGSGIIFQADGYIVTNSHVVRNETTNLVFDRVEVILSNGDKYTAQVLGSDKETDLAVLKIEATGLQTAVFGDSDKVRVGDKALVIGNPSGLAFAGSLTQGTISAVKRQVEMSSLGGKTTEFIQTDAAINPGNSGGALANEYGQIIGITSAKLVAEEYEGMGFAIPINNAKPIIESLIQDGYVSGRVELGIGYKAVSESIAQQNSIPMGLRVLTMKDDSDAKRQGLELGDIITKIDGKEVYDATTVASALDGKKPGDSVKLTVYRVGEDDRAETITITCKLNEKTE